MIRQTIEEVCSLHARIGWQGLTKAEHMDEGDYYLVTGVDFSEGLIDFVNCHYVSKDRYEQDKNIQLNNNDVLVTKDGTIGKVAIIRDLDKPATLNSGVFVVRPKDKVKLLPEYLAFALKSDHFSRFIEQIKVGCTIAHLNQAKFLKYEIPKVSISEQLQVINVLNKVENVIKNRNQQLQQLDELVKARFVELMASAELSEEMTVEQITERVKVGFVGSCEKYYTDASGIPMLRTGNITDHGIDMSDLKYVTAEFHYKNKKSQIHSGDLLIARHGSNGQANVYDGSEAQCLNAVVIVPNQGVAKSVFLAGLINSPEVKEQIDRTLVGSTQHVVNTKSIANLVVRIPCLEVQEQYESFVKQTDKSKVAVQKALDEVQTLFDSLMQEYFG